MPVITDLQQPSDPLSHIRLKLDAIYENWSSLSDSDQDWAIRLDEYFQRKQRLTPRQSDVLDDIYEKCR